MAGSLFFKDTFTTGSFVSLSSHTPDQDFYGLGWSNASSSNYCDTAGYAYRSSSTGDEYIPFTTTVDDPDYHIRFITRLNSTSSYTGVVARGGYLLKVTRTSISLVDKASGTAIASVGVTLNSSTWYTLDFHLVGTTISADLDGTQQFSVTDTKYTAAGTLELLLQNINAHVDHLDAVFDTYIIPTVVRPTAANSTSGQVTPQTWPINLTPATASSGILTPLVDPVRNLATPVAGVIQSTAPLPTLRVGVDVLAQAVTATVPGPTIRNTVSAAPAVTTANALEARAGNVIQVGVSGAIAGTVDPYTQETVIFTAPASAQSGVSDITYKEYVYGITGAWTSVANRVATKGLLWQDTISFYSEGLLSKIVPVSFIVSPSSTTAVAPEPNAFARSITLVDAISTGAVALDTAVKIDAKILVDAAVVGGYVNSLVWWRKTLRTAVKITEKIRVGVKH